MEKCMLNHLKKIKLTLLLLTSLPIFANTNNLFDSTYVSIGGGYYKSNYQSDFTNYYLNTLVEKQSFNNMNNDGYGQIGIGTNSKIGTLQFDHQLTLSKLFNSMILNTANSEWEFYQNFDFGYDWMPKFTLKNNLTAYGILGVHYANFAYIKNSPQPGSTTFNANDYQVGFDLGAGLYYKLTSYLDIGLKYQHISYASEETSGQSISKGTVNNVYLPTTIHLQNVTPSFNLIGAEVRYYIL